jgi:adhesin transport system membrane fusion protein
VQMDPTQFQSAVQELQDQRLALLLRLQRLQAERSLDTTFVPDPEYAGLAPEIAQSELDLFNARRDELTSNMATFTELVRLRNSEADILRPMVERSAVPAIDLIRAEQQYVEAEGNLTTLRTKFERARSEQHAETLIALRQIEEQIRAGQDQLQRTNIASPVRGIVNRVSVTTVGGVVGSGDPLVEIIPLDQPLRIEGRIDPRDIGFVFSGMQTSVKLTAFDFAIYGSLHGQVAHVGADTVVDETRQDARPYYEVFIDLDEASLDGPDGIVDIRPGMLAIVELEVGQRTVLQYLLRPLFRSSEALRER